MLTGTLRMPLLLAVQWGRHLVATLLETVLTDGWHCWLAQQCHPDRTERNHLVGKDLQPHS